MVFPFVFLVVAVLAHHRPVVSIVLGALGVLLLAVVIIWSRRERRDEAANTKSGAAGSV
jgi:Flp pilus assembly protein TadB